MPAKSSLLKSQKGVAIIEVLVAVSILVVVLYMLIGIQVDYFRRFHDISTETSALSGIRSMEDDIIKDEKFFTPQTGIAAFESDAISDDALASSFGPTSTAKTDVRYYTNQGQVIPGAKKCLREEGCYYTVTYYKMAIKDRRFLKDPVFSSIPMVRVNMRVRYEEPDPNDKTNSGKMVERKIYLSRLITNAIAY